MSYRITGEFSRNSTAQLASEPIRQRLPATPPTISPQRLRQLAADRRRTAAGLAWHLPETARGRGWQAKVAARWAARRIKQLASEADEIEAQADAMEATQ